MEILDWLVLIVTLAFITIYGVWQTRQQKNVESFLLSKKMSWTTVGLSIMATQASAITFLSTPGQAFSDGMRFVQFYFGLPLAMIVISVTIVPIFHRLHVFTAYEYLENRFDFKTRAFTAFLFLTQRGLAAGLTIYAPALILSVVLGWDIFWTNAALGGLVIIYTVAGGTDAVSLTQKQQMFVILVGMVIAGVLLFQRLPEGVGMLEAMQIAGKSGKLNVIDFSFDWESRYNIWSGLIGGFFLQLSYFGTDQSQVQRYLGGKSIGASRLGLLMNGFLKIPMQFLILWLGVMVFVFYQFNDSPLFFNKNEVQKVYESPDKQAYINLEQAYKQINDDKKQKTLALVEALKTKDEQAINQQNNELQAIQKKALELKKEGAGFIHKQNLARGEGKAADTNYVFITFVIQHLPTGIIGLLIAVIFCASMSSTASELNALASTSIVDVYKRSLAPNKSEQHYLNASKIATVLWGIYAIAFAEFANMLSNNLIEAVNILGSLFYGTILGIFLTAFYLKKVKANAVFMASLVAELVVIFLWRETESPFLWHYLTGYTLKISFLWYNLIGCVLVMGFAYFFQLFSKK